MKKYVLLLAFTISALNSMENQENMTESELNLLQLLQTYKITTENRVIFHIGCKTGELSAKLAQTASHIHGFDHNKKYIDTATNQYRHLKNISFTHCPSLSLDFPRQCNVVIIDYTASDDYININEHKKELFQSINQHLLQGGEIFLSIPTSDNTVHPNIEVAKEMAPVLHSLIPDITKENIINLMIPSYPSLQELLVTLEETDFEIITHAEQMSMIEVSLNDFIECYNHIITHNPIFGCIQNYDLKQALSRQFIQAYLKKIKRNEKNNILEPIISTIIHARKK
jgi:ubiquinone/menaquinone biosynthesis C-methylase UbiE